MKYVVHRRFKDKAICGEVNLPAMTICEETNGYIFHDDKLLCDESGYHRPAEPGWHSA